MLLHGPEQFIPEPEAFKVISKLQLVISKNTNLMSNPTHQLSCNRNRENMNGKSTLLNRLEKIPPGDIYNYFYKSIMLKIISVVGLGVYRQVAASMDSTFENTPYRMAAVVDLTSHIGAFRYTPHNLGVVLHCLQPRPQAFVTGAAISEAMTNESIRVWEEFVEATGTEDTMVINVGFEIDI